MMGTTPQDPKDLFREVVESLNDRDFDRFAGSHADDVVLYDHDEPIHGVDAAVAHERELYEAFLDMQYEIESIIAENGHVAARWRVTGTHEKEFQGLAPSGETVGIPAMGALAVGEGVVTEARLVYDRYGLMEQLGVLEPSTA